MSLETLARVNSWSMSTAMVTARMDGDGSARWSHFPSPCRVSFHVSLWGCESDEHASLLLSALCMDKQGYLDIGWQTDVIICNYWWNAPIADQDRVVSSPHIYVQKLALSIATLSEAPG